MTVLAALVGSLLLKPALVLASAAAIAALMRHRTAAARHAVWSGAIVATLALPILTLVLPPIRIPTPFSTMGAAGRDTRTIAASGRDTPLVVGPAIPGAEIEHDVRPPAAGTIDQLATVILVLWILGALLLGVRRVLAEIRLRRILRRAHPVSNPRIQHLLGDIALSAGVRQPVQLRVENGVTSPAVAGLLRPVLLLPAAAEQWAEPDLAAVLVHELGHVARRDGLLNLLADIAAAMYWCNPLIHLAVRRLRAESEGACDDRVLEGGAEPERYAHLLLKVAHAARGGGLPSATVAMARPRELESRLLSVLDDRVPRHPLPRWMPLSFGGLGIMVALPTATLTLGTTSQIATELIAPEPARVADSLARPSSERLPVADTYRVTSSTSALLAGPDSLLAQALVAALHHVPTHDGDLVWERAAWALSQGRDGRLVEPMLEALESRDWRVQAYAAWTLGAAGDHRAVARLIPLLQHPVWRLRAMAAAALRALQDPRAEAAMNTALTDSAWQVRLEAVEYFATLGGPTFIERITPRRSDRHVAVRLAAERALASH